jgi:16S rRNA (guanine(527)-N(7))-methyltransferase RsmG
MEKSTFNELYKQIFGLNGLSEYTTDEIIDKMYKMTEYMLEINKVMNLTAITEPEEVIAKHLADSVIAALYIEKGARICDVGCGGGFPSLPLAIARPDITVVGIDSTDKRINYVNDAASRLGLKNLTAITGRAEDLAQNEDFREQFDICTARAVASLPVLSELCIPFIKIGGSFIAMKGKMSQEEFSKASETLGCEKLDEGKITRYTLKTSDGEDERSIVILKKISKTPAKYPRNYSQIKKKPL